MVLAASGLPTNASALLRQVRRHQAGATVIFRAGERRGWHHERPSLQLARFGLLTVRAIQPSVARGETAECVVKLSTAPRWRGAEASEGWGGTRTMLLVYA